MADRKVTGSTSIVSADNADVLMLVDVSDTTDSASGTNKKITYNDLFNIPSGGNLMLFNTADQVTNYERSVFRYNSNVLEAGHFYGGTGASRTVRFGTTAAAGLTALNRYVQIQSQTPFISYSWGGTGLTGQAMNIGSGNTLVASSGNQTALGIDPNVTQTGSASYTGLLINPTETSTGSGTKNLADFQVGGTSKTRIDNTGTHIISSTGSYIDYNTTDEVTNFERARHYWNSNTYTITTDAGGTGVNRSIAMGSSGVTQLTLNTGIPKVGVQGGTASVGGTSFQVTGTMSAASGTQQAVGIVNTINQSSTAGYTGLLMNITETATGSGAKNLMDLQVGSASKFRIQNNGVIFPVQALTASAPTYVLGGMYYDTTLNKLRIGGATGWETVTSV